MFRRMLLLAVAGLVVAGVGCRHRCHKVHKSDCCPPPGGGPGGGSFLLPPTRVPTTPGPGPVAPGVGPSGYPPPVLGTPMPPPAKPGGPDVLFPDPLPGGMSAKPGTSNYLGSPAGVTAEPPKAQTVGLTGYTRMKDGLYAGGKPTLDGFDSLKKAGFRSVVYLHAPGADVSGVQDMASTRGMTFVPIEVAPENLADAVAEFNRMAADKGARPAYVFADDSTRAGAVWYMHFRTADALGDDVARLRARAVGFTDTGDEGKAFARGIEKALDR